MGFITLIGLFLVVIPSAFFTRKTWELSIHSKKGFCNLDRPTDSHRRVALGEDGLEARARAAVPQAAVSAGQRDKNGQRRAQETVTKRTDDDVSNVKRWTEKKTASRLTKKQNS